MWETVYGCFNRWNADGTLDKVLQRLRGAQIDIGAIDEELWFVDGTIVRAHRCAAGGGKKGILRNRIDRGVNRWCEKTPNNIRYINQIDSYFQGKDYRFIQIVRDGRDVILSRHPHTTHRQYHVEPEDWVADVQEGLKYQDRENFLTIRYESLTQDFEKTMATVCEHIGIDLVDEVLNFYEHASVQRNPAYFSGLEKMHNKSIGK